jgi:hypothetical protein
MGEAKEVERGSLRIWMACASCLLWAEVDEACPVGMERKPEPSKTPTQDRQDTLGVVNVGKRHDRVVSVRARVQSPLRRGLTSVSNHSSST